jgi:hypothetical protein
MHRGPIRLGALIAGQIGGGWIKPGLEPDVVVQFRGQRPGKAGATRSVDILAHRALSQVEAAGDGALGHADAMVQA